MIRISTDKTFNCVKIPIKGTNIPRLTDLCVFETDNNANILTAWYLGAKAQISKLFFR